MLAEHYQNYDERANAMSIALGGIGMGALSKQNKKLF